MAVENHNVLLNQRIDAASKKLDEELQKKEANAEELFEQACTVLLLMSRLSGRELSQYARELSKELSKEVELQRGTYGSYKIQGAKYSAALIQLGGAACGIRGFATGSKALTELATPMSLAGQGVGGIGQTAEEKQNAYRLGYQHNSEEIKRRRDEMTGSKGRAGQDAQELIQLYQRALDSLNRAKTAQVS